MATDRMPPIPADELTPAQAAAVKAFRDLRGVDPAGPFVPLLRSPELMEKLQAAGELLRYRNCLGAEISEFAILIVARRWSQNTEWAFHKPIALKAGAAQATIDAIENGARPVVMNEAQALVFDFEAEIASYRGVSDATYARAVERFGEQGVIELTSILAYYQWLAMVMNVTRGKPPEGPRIKPLPERSP